LTSGKFQAIGEKIKNVKKLLDFDVWNVLSYNGKVGIAICKLTKKREITDFCG